MKTRYRLFPFALAFVMVAISVQSAEPPPTPTPRPKTLADYAGSITLRRPEEIEVDGGITITSEIVAELAKGGKLTRGGVSFGMPGSTRRTVTDDEKRKWQVRVKKQREVIAKLELRKAQIEKEIDLIEGGRLTARAMARVEKAEIDLGFLEEEVRRARLELGRIIREARLHGAQPGWFR